MGTTADIARFVVRTSYEDIPRPAVEAAKRSAVDMVAASLGGLRQPSSGAITRYVRSLRARPEASVIGAGLRTAVAEAALANAAITHAQDYDDCGIKVNHPTVLVLPVALALGDKLRAPGKDVLTAYILGLEVQGKIAMHCNFTLASERKPNSMQYVGCLGAATAAAKLLRLSARQTVFALGIAANMAGSIRANHGTMVGPLNAGLACRAGVSAALIARAGVTASKEIVEADNGFLYYLTGPKGYDLAGLTRELGNPYYIQSPGVGLKKYASCYYTHRAVDALFQIMAQHHLTYDSVAEVEVAMPKSGLRVLAFPRPATGYQGKFSMPHVIGCALLDGEVTLDTFSDQKVGDPRVRQAWGKVKLTFPDLPHWPGLPDHEPGMVFVGNPVTVRTTDGRTYSARVDVPHGEPSDPLTIEELLAKFNDAAGPVLPSEQAGRLSDLLLHLEDVPDTRQIADLLSSARRPTRALAATR
ncbi:MAG: MmgE/PrpD family protein [Chloroflexi bacterium]|nr:MmgE/PrpD family protein [Chloroflexota bacterium]